MSFGVRGARRRPRRDVFFGGADVDGAVGSTDVVVGVVVGVSGLDFGLDFVAGFRRRDEVLAVAFEDDAALMSAKASAVSCASMARKASSSSTRSASER